MDSLLFSHILLSFLIAGSWIALVTLAAERLGSRLGGLFANLPSNILISLIFIGVSRDIPFVTSMVPALPVGLLIDTAVLLVMMIFLKFGLATGLIASVGTWMALAALAGLVPSDHLWINMAAYFAGSLVLYLVADKRMRILPVPGSGKRYTLVQMALRAGFAGALVAGVVAISALAPPYLTGIISTFPAVLLSTMVILYLNQGVAFARATGKILILSTSNIMIYGVAVYCFFPLYGIIWGTVLSFLAALTWILLLRPVTGILARNTN